jgi:peptidoglycan/xylan/chitin deacetylase (PgdA/CDA1 family)
MRLDRFITLNLVQPFRRIFALNSQLLTLNSSIPILMYHSISDDLEPGTHPYYKTCTSPAILRQHMQFLANNGYRTITISHAVKLLTGKEGEKGTSFSSLPSVKLVVLTFDDGFQDFYTHAFPMLQEFGLTATVFLSTAFIGNTPRLFSRSPSTTNHQPSARQVFQPRVSSPSTINSKLSTRHECLVWSEVEELSAAGIEMGSHTVNHPRLVDLRWCDIETELRESKNAIEDRIGTTVTSFCYPFAFPQADAAFTDRFSQTLSALGYRCCTTTDLGRVRHGDDPFCLKRLPVNSFDDQEFLHAKLAGCYDWLAWPQKITKQCKRWVAPRRGKVSFSRRSETPPQAQSGLPMEMP